MVCARCRPFHGKRQSVIMHTAQGTSSKNVPTVGERKKNAPPITKTAKRFLECFASQVKTERLNIETYRLFEILARFFHVEVTLPQIRNYCGRLKCDRKKGKRLQVILYDTFDQVSHTF